MVCVLPAGPPAGLGVPLAPEAIAQLKPTALDPSAMHCRVASRSSVAHVQVVQQLVRPPATVALELDVSDRVVQPSMLVGPWRVGGVQPHTHVVELPGPELCDDRGAGGIGLPLKARAVALVGNEDELLAATRAGRLKEAAAACEQQEA